MKKLRVLLVSPTVKSIGLIARGNFVIGHELGFGFRPELFSHSNVCQVLIVGFLKETPFSNRLADWIHIFQSKKTVPIRCRIQIWNSMNVTAFGANRFASADISSESKFRITIRTFSKLLRIINLVKIATVCADENVFGVPNIFRKQVSSE